MSNTISGDVLQSILEAQHFRFQVYSTPRMCGTWQGVHAHRYQASLHLIGRGACWLHLRDTPPIALRSGDLVLLPRDDWHVLSTLPVISGDENLEGDLEGQVTSMVCAEISFRETAVSPLFEAMPAHVLIRQGQASSALDLLARLLCMAAEDQGLGNKLVIDRLTEVLFVLALRDYLQHVEQPTGLLAALADPRLAQALSAIHDHPGRRWQVADLARIADMSRTVFAQRFHAVLGQSPIEYLTHWRMHLASNWLRTDNLPVATIAERLGYITEAAFRRAFRRTTGQTPGQVRRGT